MGRWWCCVSTYTCHKGRDLRCLPEDVSAGAVAVVVAASLGGETLSTMDLAMLAALPLGVAAAVASPPGCCCCHATAALLRLRAGLALLGWARSEVAAVTVVTPSPGCWTRATTPPTAAAAAAALVDTSTAAFSSCSCLAATAARAAGPSRTGSYVRPELMMVAGRAGRFHVVTPVAWQW